jgi:ankyrin repeat protein
VDDSSENETEVAATVEGELNNVTSICMVFDSARLYVMKLRNQSEMEQWLASIGACVAGNGSSKEESTEEKANRVHKIMRTSMYSAALYGKAGVVEQYVSSSKDLVNDTDEFGHTAAFYALQQGHNVCLSVLLNAGADPNSTIDSSENKRSLASYALEKENMRALEMLEANGATLNEEEKAMLESLNAEPVEEDEEKGDAAPSSTIANGAMADTMEQMNERGEKLDQLKNKTADLQNDTATYLDLAKQMKQKAKRDQDKKIFGIF